VEYQQPLEATYWKANLAVCAWNDIKNTHEIEIVHRHTARRANALYSMEDAAQEAYIYYHGRRFEAMKKDHFRFLTMILILRELGWSWLLQQSTRFWML
jgi:hypothetical protein